MKEKTIIQVAAIAGLTVVCTAMVITGKAEIAAVMISVIGIIVLIISYFKHIF